MAFRNLLSFASRHSARVFSPDEENRPLCVWAAATAVELPANDAGYVLEICNGIHKGPAKHKSADFLGNMTKEEHTWSLHIALGSPPEGLPWMPVKNKTTLLVGYTVETADLVRITDFEDVAGLLQLQLEKVPR